MKELDQWRETNPLVKYMDLKKITQADAATVIGVSLNTLGKWIRGDGCPSDLHMYVISGFIKLSKLKLAIEWSAWLAKKPLKIK